MRTRSKILNLLLILITSLSIAGIYSHTNSKIMPKNYIQPHNKSEIETSNATAFLKNPTHYSFKCTTESVGEVLSATLSKEGKMTIVYQSTWKNDGDHSGILFGSYNPKTNHFEGHYKTYDGRFEGSQNLIFSENGEAQGSWDNGYGTTQIRLKPQYTDIESR